MNIWKQSLDIKNINLNPLKVELWVMTSKYKNFSHDSFDINISVMAPLISKVEPRSLWYQTLAIISHLISKFVPWPSCYQTLSHDSPFIIKVLSHDTHTPFTSKFEPWPLWYPNLSHDPFDIKIWVMFFEYGACWFHMMHFTIQANTMF